MDSDVYTDMIKAHSIIVTEKCGHQQNVLIPTSTLDKLEHKLQSCVDGTARLPTLRPVVLKRDNPQPQINHNKLCLQTVELKLSSETNSLSKDCRSKDVTFETVKAMLMTEVDSHQTIHFAKNEELSALKKDIKTLKHHIKVEEVLINNSDVQSEAEVERDRLRKQRDELCAKIEEQKKALCTLLEKYFPSPTKEEQRLAGVKQKSMRKIMHILLNQLIEFRSHPDAKWVTVDSSFPQAYVMFLVKCGIVKFHPRTSNSIAMVNFGED